MPLSDAEEIELLELEKEQAHSKGKRSPNIIGGEEVVDNRQKTGQLESLLRGGGQGLTFGFSDEALAKLGELTGHGGYQDLLKEERRKNELAQLDNPLTYGGGELGATLATSLIPAGSLGGLGKLANLSTKSGLLGNVAASAASSALSGAGHSEGGAFNRLADAGIGAGMGALTGLVGGGIQKGMQSLAPKLAETATGATGKDLLTKFKPGSGEKLLEDKTIGWLSTPASIAKKAEAELEKSSSGIGKSLSKMKSPSKDTVIQKLLKSKEGLDDVADASTIKEIDGYIEKIAASKNPETAQSFWNTKKLIDKDVNWIDKSKTKADLLTSKAYRETVEGLAEPGSDLANKFTNDRQLFSTYAPIAAASKKKAATLQQRDIGGLLDTIAFSGGAAKDFLSGDTSGKGTLSGLGFAAARRGIVPRLPSLLARTMNSPVLQNAVLRGPVSIYKGLLQGDK